MFKERPRAFLALPLESGQVANEIRAALESNGFEPVDVRAPGPDAQLDAQIEGAIRRADVVVADLTGNSPWVMFEVGVAMGLGKRMLLLAQQSSTRVPADLVGAYQIARYRPDDMATLSRYVSVWLRDALAYPATAVP